eukprot:350129-Chlamydomonas_euryale.AAC.1
MTSNNTHAPALQTASDSAHAPTLQTTPSNAHAPTLQTTSKNMHAPALQTGKPQSEKHFKHETNTWNKKRMHRCAASSQPPLFLKCRSVDAQSVDAAVWIHT